MTWMRRACLVASTLGLLACGDSVDLLAPAADEAGLAGGPALSLAGGPVASASGGGHWFLVLPDEFGLPPIEQVLGFNAQKFADGSVHGRITYQQSFLDFHLRFEAVVTCMNVYDGNRVKYGGLITSSNDPDFPAGGFIWFQGIDNGEGAGAAPDLSTGSGFGDESGNEAFCASPAPPNPTFIAEIDGDIQVRE